MLPPDSINCLHFLYILPAKSVCTIPKLLHIYIIVTQKGLCYAQCTKLHFFKKNLESIRVLFIWTHIDSLHYSNDCIDPTLWLCHNLFKQIIKHPLLMKFGLFPVLLLLKQSYHEHPCLFILAISANLSTGQIQSYVIVRSKGTYI